LNLKEGDWVIHRTQAGYGIYSDTKQVVTKVDKKTITYETTSATYLNGKQMEGGLATETITVDIANIKEKPYMAEYDRIGEEILKVKKAELKCNIYKWGDGERMQKFWISDDVPFGMVKFESGKVKTELINWGSKQ
jgi:hypothetical protein